jgi:hypothetical protein
MDVPNRTEANRLSLERFTSIPKDAFVTFMAVDWFNSVQQFKVVETGVLQEQGKLEAVQGLHRAVVAELISQGEALAIHVQEHGLVSDADFTIDDVRATIDSLRETFRGAHGPHNHPKTNERILAILRAA